MARPRFTRSFSQQLSPCPTRPSGSYMLYARHGAGPSEEAFRDARLDTPNLSARMDNPRAALLRPQLRDLEAIPLPVAPSLVCWVEHG